MNTNLNILDKAIICNNCLGAKFYKVHEYEFNNPFMWNCIEPVEFVRLIENFYNIDLSKPKFELLNRRNRNYVNAIIGNKINFNFIHYICDETKSVPTKIDADILYKDILNYAKQKYFKRLSKMPHKTVFVFNCSHYPNEQHFINSSGDKLLKKLNDMCKYKNINIIVILDSKHTLKFEPNFYLIKVDNLYGKSAAELLSLNNDLDKEISKYIFE